MKARPAGAVPIPNWTYLRELDRCEERIISAVSRVLHSGRVILGQEVEAFEREFAAYVGSGLAVGLNSGTDAITMALLASGLKPGDEVITAPNTAVPTVSAIRQAGGFPVFVDVDPETLLIDPGKIASVITSQTRVIVPVHLYGQPADMERILSIARAENLEVVEDCAQAHGTRYKGKMVGTFGMIGAYSFYPTKPLGAYGDAGACVTSNDTAGAFLRAFREYGTKDGVALLERGMNSRLDELQAAILREKLCNLEAWLAERRRIADIYDGAFRGTTIRPVGRRLEAGSSRSHYVYVVRVAHDRDGIRRKLSALGIETRIHYPVPIHLMPGFAFMGYRKGAFPEAERAAGEILSLPIFPGMTQEEARETSDVLLGCIE